MQPARLADKYGPFGGHIYEVLRKVHPDNKPVEILSFLSAQNPIAYLTAERKAAQRAAPVYLYLFAWHTKMLDGRPRAFHCSEIPFVFYNTGRCETYTGGTEEAARLSEKMAKAWIRFARSGNPNHEGIPDWPSFTRLPGATMIFDNTCRMVTDPDGEARRVLEGIFYRKEM